MESVLDWELTTFAQEGLALEVNGEGEEVDGPCGAMETVKREETLRTLRTLKKRSRKLYKSL